jgi:hypothetical protein
MRIFSKKFVANKISEGFCNNALALPMLWHYQSISMLADDLELQ